MSDEKRMSSDAAMDNALHRLPREIEPSRDLWPGIRAVIESTPVSARAPRRAGFGWWGQIAAGIALIVVSSAATHLVTRQPSQAPTTTTVASASYDADIAAEYLRARAELDRQFAERIGKLPPATRAKLVSNLADVRRAADEILANLATHPSDPLLYELLISTYQSEAQLLASAEALTVPLS